MSTMAAPSRGYRAVTSLILAAAVLTTSDGTITDPKISNLPPVTQTGPIPEYEIHSGVVLSRPPILTRTLSPFEASYFLYQKRLNERLSMPFGRYFYHKEDSPQDVDWKRKVKDRNGVAARDVGGYQAYGEEGWNDEVLVGDKLASPQTIVDALLKDAEVVSAEDGGTEAVRTQIAKPLERYTDADKKKDYKRLDRKLARTLYLCVKMAHGWAFPQGPLIGRENLHQAAERILVQSAGINMNTWIVGNAPIGHRIFPPRYTAADKITIKVSGERTFFMKGRIMAGQANLEGNLFGLQDFKWLTKQELSKVFSKQYYSHVVNMLADR